jgi:ribose transport system ATP-binding protein
VSDSLLEVRNLSKAFGASRALSDVTFDLAQGEVHALIGENGAGKSTLMKVLSGALRPDSGTMTLGGSPYAPRSPRDAQRHGVAMIYQELALAPHLSVEANILLGRERSIFGVVRQAVHRKIVAEALRLLDHPEIRPDRIVNTLSIGARQLVEVARALVANARVVIFDEPTSSLSERDAARLFDVIRRMRDSGISIVYISHFLEEVRAVAERYTVLRDGSTVMAGSIPGTPIEALVRAMVGREITEVFPRVPHEPRDPILELSGFRVRARLPIEAELTVRRGEILGIAGLIGAGRTELLRSIFGLEKVTSGKVRVKGNVSIHATPHHRIREGFGFLSEDRKEEGLALRQSIEDNVTLSALGRHARLGVLNLWNRRRVVERLAQSVHLHGGGPDTPIVRLSGGNQQKVALARLLHQEADVFLLDEPTRGIDIGSKAEIYRLIGTMAARGVAVVLVSAYLPEILGVCDRVAVMCRGKLTEVRPVADWDEHSIMAASTAI